MEPGGKRDNSGRRPLHETAKCQWIVKRVREISQTSQRMDQRKAQLIQRRLPKRTEQFTELTNAYSQLSGMTQVQRQGAIHNDIDTPLEEIRLTLEDLFPQHFRVAPPNQFEMKSIYVQVAREATAQFSQLTTHRNVKDCVAAWLKFEHSVHTSD